MKVNNSMFENLKGALEYMIDDAKKRIENLKSGKFSESVKNAKYAMLRQKYGEIKGMLDFLYCIYTDEGKGINDADERIKNFYKEADNIKYEINSLS